MDSKLYKALLELSRDPEVSAVFRTKVPKTLTNISIPLSNTDKWLTQVYDGMFIDSKFDESWLSYNGITKTSLHSVRFDWDKVCELFKECVRDCVRISDKYDSFDTFLYNPETFRSGFLRHAVKILSGTTKKELSKSLSHKTLHVLNDLQEKCSQPIWGSVQNIVQWYTENSDNLYIANYASLEHQNSLTLNNILFMFVSYIDETLEVITPSVMRIGSRYWWEFVHFMRNRSGLILSPTTEEVEHGHLVKQSSLRMHPTTPIRPKEFMLWPYELQFIWRLKYDPHFKATIERTHKKVLEIWESTGQDENAILEYFKKYS